MCDEAAIAKHLTQLLESSEDIQNESQILREWATPLLLQLGYSEDEIFFDYSTRWLDQFYQVDAVVAVDRRSRPWLLVEARLHGSVEDFRHSLDVLSGLGRKLRAHAAMFLTPNLISIATAEGWSSEWHLRFEAMTPSAAKELIELVGRPTLATQRPTDRYPWFGLTIESSSGRFFVDRSLLEKRLVAACEATDSASKGKLFEELAAYILSGLTDVEIRKKNTMTATGELDIVCRLEGADAFRFFSRTADRYFVVECKNWQSPVGAREIEILVGKLQKCRATFGFLFSRNGITGRTGRDAVGNVEASWRQHGIIILVITEEIIRQVIEGHDFYSICEDLYEAVRFSER